MAPGRLKADVALSEWARNLMQRLGTEASFARGWQSSVAKQLGLHRSEVSKILRGHRAIDWSVAVRLAERAGVELRFYEAASGDAPSPRPNARVAKQVATLLEAHFIAERKAALSDEIRRLSDEIRRLHEELAATSTTVEEEREAFKREEREIAEKRRWFATLDREIDAQRKILNRLRSDALALRQEQERTKSPPIDGAGAS